MARFIAISSVCVLVGVTLLVSTANAAKLADGLKCFKISDPLTLKGIANLDSADLGLDAGCKIGRARTYCVPVASTVVSAEGPTGPLLAISGPNPGDRICYKVKCAGVGPASREISDVFGTRTIGASRAMNVCLPVVKGAATAGQSAATCSDPLAAGSYVLDCNEGGGNFSSGTIAPIAGSPELHVFSIYEAGVWSGSATVTVDRLERSVLVLIAYESVSWPVNVAPGAQLERVVVVGAELQAVSAPPGVVVENLSPSENSLGFDSYMGATDYPEPDALQLIQAAESATGLCLTSFHGCYDGSQFAVPAAE